LLPFVALTNVTAANRFGLGARPGELRLIGPNPREWLKGQLRGSRPIPEAMRGLPGSADVVKTFRQAKGERRKALAPIYQDQVAARYRVAAATPEPFRERLVHFWTNHFAVSADKAQVIALAATLENEAIRPHIGASFVRMLHAVEAHPAMILYLDNQASIGPHSQLASRAQRRARSGSRKLGINENLAREILELHTLGVNGGYSQRDVTTFAQALTGWSIGGTRALGNGKQGEFEFHEQAHEPGAKTILGKRYGQEGAAQPRAVLDDLARHPATARHVATKLARHFIADDPPAAAVDRIAKAFTDSDGDLPRVHEAVIDAAEAAEGAGAKFKTPHDFVVSAFRMLDFVPELPQQILAPFQLLGQRPYSPGSPAGWPDTADRWDGPDALLKRIEWAAAVGDRIANRIQPLSIGEQSLGAALSERTRTAVARAASAAQGVTLLLASPEFQRR
jgi:uncharacterized protein (DUF1800 family)